MREMVERAERLGGDKGPKALEAAKAAGGDASLLAKSTTAWASTWPRQSSPTLNLSRSSSSAYLLENTMLPLIGAVYKARGVVAQLGETGGGKPQVGVQFSILDEGMQGERITAYLYFTEKTTERSIESLRICGWQGDDLTDLQGIQLNEVELVCEPESYQGPDDQEPKTTLKVKWINAPGGGGLRAPMAPDKAKSFAAQMKGQIRAFDQKHGIKTPSNGSAGRPVPPPHTDDDIPF